MVEIICNCSRQQTTCLSINFEHTALYREDVRLMTVSITYTIMRYEIYAILAIYMPLAFLEIHFYTSRVAFKNEQNLTNTTNMRKICENGLNFHLAASNRY